MVLPWGVGEQRGREEGAAGNQAERLRAARQTCMRGKQTLVLSGERGEEGGRQAGTRRRTCRSSRTSDRVCQHPLRSVAALDLALRRGTEKVRHRMASMQEHQDIRQPAHVSFARPNVAGQTDICMVCIVHGACKDKQTSAAVLSGKYQHGSGTIKQACKKQIHAAVQQC